MKTAQLGIELGTRHLRICTRDKEEFLKIKNMIAFDEDAKLKETAIQYSCSETNGTRRDLRLYEYEISVRNGIGPLFQTDQENRSYDRSSSGYYEC